MNELVKAVKEFKELQEALDLEKEYSQFLEAMLPEENEKIEAEEEEKA